MTVFGKLPELSGVPLSIAILVGSYAAARLISFLFGKLLARPRSGPGIDPHGRLIAALKAPLTSALFLVGAYVAIQRLSLPERWTGRLESGLFSGGVLLLALALIRSYGILIGWYVTESRHARDGIAREFGPLFGKVGNMLIVLVGLIVVLNRYDINVASLVVSLGVGSLAVGLAAQDTLSNMFAGFTLMLDRPFRIGDRIKLASGEVGDIEAIGMRATRMKMLDETILVVPNSTLVKERVVNQTRPTRGVTTRVEVGVAYGSDLAEVKRVLRESALASAHVDPERPPEALVTRFGDFSVNLALTFRATDYTEQELARSEVHEEIYRRFAGAGVEIPLPPGTAAQSVRSEGRTRVP